MSTQSTRETWCSSCETHYTLPQQPLCPGCAADEAKKIRGENR